MLVEESADLANDISRICEGHNTIAVYMAVSMFCGASAACAPRPDFDGMMVLINQTAKHYFDIATAPAGA
jgi:hypothetical protein